MYGKSGFPRDDKQHLQTDVMIKSLLTAVPETWALARALGSPGPICHSPSGDHPLPCLGVQCDSRFFNVLGSDQLIQYHRDPSSSQPENHYLQCFLEKMHIQRVYLQKLFYNQPTANTLNLV